MKILNPVIIISCIILSGIADKEIHAVDLKNEIINITDDGNEWPPYIYYKRVNGHKTEELTGFSIDVITEILNENEIKFQIKLLPWKRAQVEVGRGTSYLMFLNATYNKGRAKKYYISESYYSTNGYYFYSRKKYPSGLPIRTKNDLKKYRITGLLGHNYSDYGINEGNAYLGSGDYESLSLQLHTGRYDLFLESYEIVAGWSILNKNIFKDKDLGYARISDMNPVNFYMMFTKNEKGLELKRIVDEGINKMKKNGQLQKLKDRYFAE